VRGGPSHSPRPQWRGWSRMPDREARRHHLRGVPGNEERGE
jgi:hypothetical protein